MADHKYYVVEARFPVQVSEAASPEEAARMAARIIQRDYNVDISNWFLRVFEYGESDVNGPAAEYFSSPGGKFRLITQNVEKHAIIIREGANDYSGKTEEDSGSGSDPVPD